MKHQSYFSIFLLLVTSNCMPVDNDMNSATNSDGSKKVSTPTDGVSDQHNKQEMPATQSSDQQDTKTAQTVTKQEAPRRLPPRLSTRYTPAAVLATINDEPVESKDISRTRSVPHPSPAASATAGIFMPSGEGPVRTYEPPNMSILPPQRTRTERLSSMFSDTLRSIISLVVEESEEDLRRRDTEYVASGDREPGLPIARNPRHESYTSSNTYRPHTPGPRED